MAHLCVIHGPSDEDQDKVGDEYSEPLIYHWNPVLFTVLVRMRVPQVHQWCQAWRHKEDHLHPNVVRKEHGHVDSSPAPYHHIEIDQEAESWFFAKAIGQWPVANKVFLCGIANLFTLIKLDRVPVE